MPIVALTAMGGSLSIFPSSAATLDVPGFPPGYTVSRIVMWPDPELPRSRGGGTIITADIGSRWATVTTPEGSHTIDNNKPVLDPRFPNTVNIDGLVNSVPGGAAMLFSAWAVPSSS